ncbi:MAG TPA: glycerol kinase GlpK [Phycisphaerae bacterium]|jgi:glycerol kinase|nr:glycerol kinase GlpK [Phycisphaerae bacterium]HOB76819.1 glycerol kinase GlpK [Phycisphaerae bacterium]HOJ56860.1 glycerol kinase GlpK [Phycisphaerae bacterium]HOL28471.1 glycerol kinase GlpK [Phycisphaerae bacterium]HPP22974.1 glycerol kinase GlpK [Phycisphaerae bacterium]
MADCVLALDLGTTGNRAIVFNDQCQVVAQAYEEFTQRFPQTGWVEHDPEEIWRSILSCIQVVRTQVPAEAIAAIGITNQRETAVLWDAQTGRPVYNAIVWQDVRTAPRCEMLKERHADEVRRKTGLLIDPYFSATKIAWVLEHVEEARRLAGAGRLLFGTIDSWILWKLTGGRVHATDPSNASRTLLRDIARSTWDEGLARIFDIEGVKLPEVRPSLSAFGAADPGVLGRELPITAILGDQQASLFVQCGSSGETVKNTYGTGLFLMICTGERMPLCDELLTTIAWQRAGGPLEYALEGSVLVGGAAIQWLRDGLGIIQSSAESGELAHRVPSNEGVYFVPALAGLGAPYWDRFAGGLIIGLTRGTRREHLARAALESLAYQTRDVVEAMERQLGRRIRSLRADGKPSQNDFLMQFQADMLGVPVTRSAVTETTALGAAVAAGIAAGIWDEKVIDNRPAGKVFEPRMSDDEREALYARWREAVKRARAWNGPA